MNRRTFVLLSGAASGSLLVPPRGSLGWVPLDGRLSFEFDDRHRWSLWYRGEGTVVPLLPFAPAGIHLDDRTLTLGDLDDVTLQAGTPPSGESTVIRGRAAGLFVEATFLTEPSAPAPRASITLRIYPDTDLPVVSGLAWASVAMDHALAGPGELLAQVDQGSPAIFRTDAVPELRSSGMLALTRRSGTGAVRALGIIPQPGGTGLFQATAGGGRLTLETTWAPAPGRPVSTDGDTESVTFCYDPRGDGIAALTGAAAPAAGDRDFLATLVPPAGLWLTGGQGRGEDLIDLITRAPALFDPRFARFVAFDLDEGGPRGHRWCTDQIHGAGLLAAGSLAPFTADDGSTLDPADPDARMAIRERARVAVQDWGYDCLILHSLESAFQLAAHAGSLTHLEALRAGLAAIHEGAGSLTLWSASRVQQTGTLGVVRVGTAPGPGWNSAARLAVTAGLRSYYHRSWWLNDPGPLTLGYPLSLEEARTQLGLVALMGGATLFAPEVLDVPEAQVDLVRRVLPPAPVAGRPLDAAAVTGNGADDAGPPSLWTARAGGWSTALVVNWKDDRVERVVRLADLGLAPGTYHAYDAWNDLPVRATDPLHVALDGHDSLLLGLRPRVEHPQVIGTTRHVIQGAVDLQDEHWDAKAQILSGRAVNLDGRPYAVTVGAAGWAPDELRGDRAGTVRAIDSEYLVLEWPGGERGDFAWQLSLKRAPRPARRARTR